MRTPIAATTLCLTALLLAAGSSPSRADFRVCNMSGSLTAVAVGFSDSRSGWVSRGWFAVPAGNCQTVFSGDLGRGIYYVFGQDSQGSCFAAPTTQIGGFFCTQPAKFELRNNDYLNASNALDCTAHGFKALKFQQVDVDNANYTFTLSPTPAPNVNSLVGTLITAARANAPATTAPTPVTPVSAPAAAPLTPDVVNPTGSSASPTACQRYPNLC